MASLGAFNKETVRSIARARVYVCVCVCVCVCERERERERFFPSNAPPDPVDSSVLCLADLVLAGFQRPGSLLFRTSPSPPSIQPLPALDSVLPLQCQN